MERRRFDDLAIAVATDPRSRRRVLGSLAGGALATLLGGWAALAATCKNDGAKCAKGTSCCSGICAKNGKCKKDGKLTGKCRCAPATCTDGTTNGDETDIDCGGSCGGCAAGKICLVAADCLSGVCTGGACQQATCTDTVQNGDETDVDCGGPDCPQCAEGKACLVGTDCVNGACVSGTCGVL